MIFAIFESQNFCSYIHNKLPRQLMSRFRRPVKLFSVKNLQINHWISSFIRKIWALVLSSFRSSCLFLYEVMHLYMYHMVHSAVSHCQCVMRSHALSIKFWPWYAFNLSRNLFIFHFKALLIVSKSIWKSLQNVLNAKERSL